MHSCCQVANHGWIWIFSKREMPAKNIVCRHLKGTSSSSIGCGAGDHKVSPCTTIISKCGNLLFLHCSFIIPKQSLYIGKVWSMWSTRSPFASGWDVQSISSSRLFLWHSEDVTKKFQLAVPNQVNQRHSVSHGIDGGVQNMVNALYIQHDSERESHPLDDWPCTLYWSICFDIFKEGGQTLFKKKSGSA